MNISEQYRLTNAIYMLEGCLVLPGAQPALGGTPGMMGYGMAKAAIHQLTKSLASADSGLPSDAKTFALLPITLGMYKKDVTSKRIKYIYIYILSMRKLSFS